MIALMRNMMSSCKMRRTLYLMDGMKSIGSGAYTQILNLINLNRVDRADATIVKLKRELQEWEGIGEFAMEKLKDA